MGRNWAITIGINGYRNLQKLEYAKRDAESVRDYFLNDLGFQMVYHFSDDSAPITPDQGEPIDSHPTFASLRRFFRIRFDTAFLRPGDNLWFFFAGHGVRHEDRDYLMPIDADPGDISATGIPLNYITERLQRCGADNVILFIDACRSGVGKRDGLGIGQEKQQGVITLFSCSPSEASYEIEPLQQGAFTYALLEGLRIQGEGNCATVERLYQYLRYAVPQLSQRYNKPLQTPYGRVEPPTKYHLILLPRQATLADIATLKNDALTAEVRKDYRLAKQLWIRVLAASPADPNGIEGIERLAQVSAAPTTSPPPSSSSESGRSVQPVIVVPSFEFEVVRVDAKGQVTDRRKGQAEYRREDLGNGVKLDLVVVPGGTFVMGSPETEEGRFDRESPHHQVTVRSFLMGKYPVTQAQWKAVVAFPKVELDLNPDPFRFKGESRPVESVSWYDAIEFCQRLSKKTGRDYRLPSEAEWEYACRAGTTTPFYCGETITTDLANYRGTDWEYEGKTYPGFYGQGPRGSYRQETTEVGLFLPNALGLYDMHGNVWEWCLDHWHENYGGFFKKAPIDGSAWIKGGEDKYRLLRGGSWYYIPRACRSALRSRLDPDNWDHDIGFRVVVGSAWTLS